jgi:KaiC/GvpD/RAD55 family RecA-like ATPase
VNLSTGDSGLDLVLGGGIPLVHRPNASAVILVRGGPGAGKTCFALQLAMAAAKERGGDIAYGCVEILPLELRAQKQGLWVSEPWSNVPVVVPAEGGPWSAKKTTSSHSWIYAATLDLEASDRSREQLGREVLALRESVPTATVVVIDSLAPGYHLGGADVPREYADAVVKLAVDQSLVLILVEESDDDRSSPWRFAVDLVFELEHATSERRLRVTKNRFGPCDVGPHALTIEPGEGIRVSPRMSAYYAPWSRVGQDWKTADRRERKWPVFTKNDLLEASEAAWLIHGSDPALVRRIARKGFAEGNAGTDVHIGLGPPGDPMIRDRTGKPDAIIDLPNPFEAPELFVDRCVRTLNQLAETARVPGYPGHEVDRRIRRILIGDLAAFPSFVRADDYLRALRTLIWIAQARYIPIVLFETTTGTEPPPASRWVDVVVEVVPPDEVHPTKTAQISMITATHVQTGKRDVRRDDRLFEFLRTI